MKPEDASPTRSTALGAVLAGGAGRRIGGDKATVELLGRPLVQWVIDCVAEVTADVAVVVKSETKLPRLDPEIAVWREPEQQQHPLNGIVEALARAHGRPVLVVATDLPLMTAAVLERLALEAPAGSHGRVAALDGRPQPLCARYEPSALALLQDFAPAARATERVLEIGVELEEFSDPLPFFNVNAPEDLLTAAAEIKRRG